MLDAQNVSAAPLELKNTPSMRMSDAPWYLYGERVGSHIPTSTIQQIPALKNMQDPLNNSKKLRQFAAGHIHATAGDIGGFCVAADIGAIWLYKDQSAANKWAKQIDRNDAPSFRLIDNGQGNVSFDDCFVSITSNSEMCEK